MKYSPSGGLTESAKDDVERIGVEQGDDKVLISIKLQFSRVLFSSEEGLERKEAQNGRVETGEKDIGPMEEATVIVGTSLGQSTFRCDDGIGCSTHQV